MPKKRYDEYEQELDQALEAQPEEQCEMPTAPPAPVESPKVDFDAWWAMVERKIPAHHRKEVIWADLRARGLSQNESLKDYNAGLQKYGLKLK